MAATGTATINFGAKETTASVAVTGQAAITGASFVEAWIAPVATASNTADNHWAEHFNVVAGNIVAGTGFTIYAAVREGFAHGLYTVNWVWT